MAEDKPSFRRRSRFGAAFLSLILLAILGGQLLHVVRTKSPTIDEKTKIMLGYFPLATGEWRFQVENPPFTNMFQALPLLLIPDRPDPTQYPQWDDPAWQDRWPSAFFTEVAQDFPYTFAVLIAKARMMNILLTLATSVLIGYIAYRWFGVLAGMTALAWLTFSPNWLAHGSLANNDLLIAGLYLLTICLFWMALHTPGWKSILLTGLSLGIALGTKTSSLLLLPAMAGVAVLYLVGIQDASQKLDLDRDNLFIRSRRILLVLIASAITGFLSLWAMYGFETGAWPKISLPLPLPTYLRKVFLPTFRHVTTGHTSYLMGERSTEGWWYYFPVIFLVKTPLPTILGAAVGAVDLLRRRKWLTFAILTIPPVIWLAASMVTRLNIGYRHILTILPFMVFFIASLFWDVRMTRWRIGLAVVLFTWLIIGTISLSPSYLSYFNEIAGGPQNGIQWASDSNLDWGQDLQELKRYLEKEDIPFIYLSYFGIPELPDQYQINYHPFPNFFDHQDPLYTPYNPPEGIYAISATHRTGQTVYPVFNEDAVDWFNHREPCDIVGTTIYIYCVETDPNPPVWLRLCSGIESYISEETAKQKLGRPNIPAQFLDCSETVSLSELPNGPGWILLPDPEIQSTQLSEQLKASGTLQFVHRNFQGDPLFRLYRVEEKHRE